MTTTYTFKRYTWGEYEANHDDGLAVSGVMWDAYPIAGVADWDAVIGAAGWQQNDETAIGVLTRAWNGHPEDALIISDNTIPGYQFAVSHERTTSMATVTADDVRDLLTSGSMDPTLLRWLDTGEVDVVAGVLLSDISYSNYDREYEILATANDLRQVGDWDINHPTDEDFEAFAAYLNEAG